MPRAFGDAPKLLGERRRVEQGRIEVRRSCKPVTQEDLGVLARDAIVGDLLAQLIESERDAFAELLAVGVATFPG